MPRVTNARPALARRLERMTDVRFTTRGGYKAEVLAQRDGVYYGRAEGDAGGWIPASWNPDGTSEDGLPEYDLTVRFSAVWGPVCASIN